MNTTTKTANSIAPLNTSRRMFRAAAVVTVGIAASTVMLMNPALARQGRGSDNASVTSNSSVTGNSSVPSSTSNSIEDRGESEDGPNHDLNDDSRNRSSASVPSSTSNTTNTTNTTATSSTTNSTVSSTPSSSVKPAAPTTSKPVGQALNRGRGRGRGGRA